MRNFEFQVRAACVCLWTFFFFVEGATQEIPQKSTSNSGCEQCLCVCVCVCEFLFWSCECSMADSSEVNFKF